MSKEKSQLKEVSDMAKNIWLAGLGAYGRAFDEAQERYEQASKETPRLFTELVEKGRNLESQARTAIDDVASKGKGTATSLEERISKVRANLGFGGVSSEDFERLEKKVDALAKKVNSLSAAPKKAPAKRAAASKAATAE
ncbi:polyhydroxyalkanoate synthesis regulator phasin [Litorivivens lipolytica]|uniref:Polyhydroxyalkanoate synthesis regulator phasin n=1 Tax=Litorivivens lipolytica TaxID=1524264 RepID=A0A7W4Z6V2_9GAMM|nr:phasin family protein [Litorivivens lipolytica]MBB3047266.1 polyhydroxyalkanoate synthesis regulator phasin [Litorivivens lipolytica]